MARFASSQGSSQPRALKPQDSVTVQGATPKIIIGDAGAEDTMLVFDGNAQDFYIALDDAGDSADDLVIGTGLTAGTNALMTISNGGNVGIGTTSPDHLLEIESSSASEPVLSIKNTHAGATSGELRFSKDTASGDDDDVMGVISFYGTDADENTEQKLAHIDAIITDSAEGSEAASLRFYVAENDGTVTTAGLTIAGQADANGEIDVTIGAGVMSTTTVSGQLAVLGGLSAMRRMDALYGTAYMDAAGEGQGDIVYFGTGATDGSLTAGKIYYYKSDGAWALTDANATATSAGVLSGVALAATSGYGVLLRGMVKLAADIQGADDVGSPLYLSEEAGEVDATAPSASGDVVRVVGYCISPSTEVIWFNPDHTWVEVA